ncbi:ATP-dependent DNA helicase [Trichonephila clavipes]|nr:ATP-dependent DNA helicase [Trichonephila clavipes]
MPANYEKILQKYPEECVVKESIVEELFGSSLFVRVPSRNVTYFSVDSIIYEDQEEQNNFQVHFLNGITPSGMPPHVLNLKVGAIIMLLRNLNPST